MPRALGVRSAFASRRRLPRSDDRASGRFGPGLPAGADLLRRASRRVAALLVYEHALVRPDDLTRVNVAFFQVNVIISMGLLVVGVVDLLV